MAIENPTLQHILKSYTRQQTTSRNIEKLKKTFILPKSSDSVTLSMEGKRQQMAESITKEVVHNLLTSNTNNSFIKEIKADLEKEFATGLDFQFSPKENQIIVRKENGEEIAKDTQKEIIDRLWEITSNKVQEILT